MKRILIRIPLKIFISSILIVSYLCTFSQSELTNWYFAGGNGLTFSSGAPVNIPGGQIFSAEGASSVSDKNGNLLFYTNGMFVWNRSHSIMPNGSDLAGGYGSSSQSSLIVPKTKDERLYYIFTVDEHGGPRGLQYSVVEMSPGGGSGIVIEKNTPLVGKTQEKITAVLHCNRKDYWIIVHGYESDAYYAFLATDTGVSRVPVISHVGSYIPERYPTVVGCMKASPDGKKLAAAHGGIGVDLSDFDNSTGVVSNAIEIFKNSNSVPYGVEFSASSNYLYVAVTHYWDTGRVEYNSGVFQYNVLSTIPSDIISSKLQLRRYPLGNEMGTLQRGPDKKIYLSPYRRNYLSVINNPDISGLACDFKDTALVLPEFADYSLPNFLNEYIGPDSFLVSSPELCTKRLANFSYTLPGNVTSVQWDFGDPASGASNFSNSLTPTHTFSSTGIYSITLFKYGPCGNDTLRKQLRVEDLFINLGPDTAICEQATILLNPQAPVGSSFQWQDGTITPTALVSNPGVYWVDVTNNSNGCIRRDSIIIISKPLPIVNIGKDTSLCINQVLLLNAQNTGATYLWQDGSTQQTIQVNQSGRYHVAVEVNGCKATDTITISAIQNPAFTLGPDKKLCPEQTLELIVNLTDISIKWQDGSVQPAYLVRQTGVYFADVTNACGTTRDSVTILPTTCSIKVPNAFTPNGDGKNEVFRISGGFDITEFTMTIFNRWGQKIFETKDKLTGWNGQYLNKNCPIGSYVFLINYKDDNSNQQKQIRGNVLLLR